MAPMRCLAALGVALALALTACTKDEPAMPATCTTTHADGYARALRAVPAPVRLPGGTRISECLRRVRTDSDLQDLGVILYQVADRLGDRARAGRDPAAARELGYLAGAVRAGAERSNGISSELSRRIDRSGIGIDELSPTMARALQAGLVAGGTTG